MSYFGKLTSLLVKHSVTFNSKEYPPAFIVELKELILEHPEIIIPLESLKGYEIHSVYASLAQDLDFLHKVISYLVDPQRITVLRLEDVLRVFTLNPSFDLTFLKRVCMSLWAKELVQKEVSWYRYCGNLVSDEGKEKKDLLKVFDKIDNN